jgi:hypothetical protein
LGLTLTLGLASCGVFWPTRVPPPPPQPAEPEPAPAPEPAPLPQLGPVLSPALRTELPRQTEALPGFCDRAVAGAARRRFTPAQAILHEHLRTLAQLARGLRPPSGRSP